MPVFCWLITEVLGMRGRQLTRLAGACAHAFAGQTLYYVGMAEDPDANFRTNRPHH